MVVGSVIGSVNATAANIVGGSLGQTGDTQGQFNLNPPDVPQSTYVNTSLIRQGGTTVNTQPGGGS